MSALLAAYKDIKVNKKQNAEQSITHETVTLRSRPSTHNVEQLPFNIDEIFQADVDRFGQLKEVIKYILDQLEKCQKQVHYIDTKTTSKMMQVDK